MRGRFQALAWAVTFILGSLWSSSPAGQAPAARAPYTPPTTARGEPDLQGIWQTLNSAAWNIEDHEGATGVPAGKSVVEGGPLPYLPDALAKRKENFAARKTADPESKCWLPGVPRITYMPFPFQILQFERYIVINYEYLNTTRYIYMDGTPSPDPDVIDFFMGSSNGRWEGNTLVVDVTNNNDRTWFDRAGNHHSDAMRLVERYTPIGPDHMQYEVTVTDPKTFSRPWKMSMPLYRRVESNAELLEYECFAYAEEDAEAAEAAGGVK